MQELFRRLSQHFEIVVFTASLAKYVNAMDSSDACVLPNMYVVHSLLNGSDDERNEHSLRIRRLPLHRDLGGDGGWMRALQTPPHG